MTRIDFALKLHDQNQALSHSREVCGSKYTNTIFYETAKKKVALEYI